MEQQPIRRRTEIEEKDARIAELEAKVARLQAQIERLSEKPEEEKQQSASANSSDFASAVRANNVAQVRRMLDENPYLLDIIHLDLREVRYTTNHIYRDDFRLAIEDLCEATPEVIAQLLAHGLDLKDAYTHEFLKLFRSLAWSAPDPRRVFATMETLLAALPLDGWDIELDSALDEAKDMPARRGNEYREILRRFGAKEFES